VVLGPTVTIRLALHGDTKTVPMIKAIKNAVVMRGILPVLPGMLLDDLF
jgi:hypothetical protein